MDHSHRKQPLPSSVFILDAHGIDLNTLHQHYHSQEAFTGTIKRYRRIDSDGNYALDTDSPQGLLTMRVDSFSNRHYGRYGFNTEVRVEIIQSLFAPQEPKPESVLYLARPGFFLTLVYNYQYQTGILSRVETNLRYPNHIEHSEHVERNFMRSIAIKISHIFDSH